MANINRDYLIVCDVKKSNVTLGNGTMAFNILDENTSNIFINLVVNTSDNALIQKYANIENAEDYRVIMNIVKPTNEVMSLEAKLHDKDLALFEIELPANATNAVGNYACELLTKCTVNGRQEVTTSNALSYSVAKSVFTDIEDSEILESETYPLVMELFDKLHDIDRYEEDRRQAEIIRQLNEEARIADYDKFKVDVVEDLEAFRQEQKDSISDNLNAFADDMTAQLIEKKAYVDGVTDEIVDRLDEFTAEFEEYDKDLTNAENTLEGRLDSLIGGVEAKENQLDNLVSNISGKFEGLLDDMEEEVAKIEDRYNNSELGGFLNRLETIEEVNRIQEVNIANEKAINRNQDVSIACLFANSQDQMVSIDVEGNSVQLANSKDGYALVNEIQGRTMVNLNKDVDKELVLTEPIALEGQEVITDKGVDGAKVDVAVEGKTMVNLIDQEGSFPLTMSYTVETGNNVAFQGDYDGKAKPYITGNTLVNLCKTFTWGASTSWHQLTNLQYSITSKTITVCNLSDTNYIRIQLSYLDNTYKTQYRINPRSIKVINVDSSSQFRMLQGYFDEDGWVNTKEDFEIFKKSVVILEGDYTNKPIPSYFEGMKSSFEEHESKSIVPTFTITETLTANYQNVYIVEDLGSSSYSPKHNTTEKIKPSTKYTIAYRIITAPTEGGYYLHNYSKDICPLSPSIHILAGTAPGVYTALLESPSTIASGQCIAIRGQNGTGRGNAKIEVLGIFEGDWTSYDFANYVPGETKKYKVDYVSNTEGKQSIKTVYLNSPLLEGDSIEEQGNNIVHVHRYESLIIPTSGDWMVGNSTNDVKTELYSATVGGTNIHRKAKINSETNRCTNAITDKLDYSKASNTVAVNYVALGTSGLSISLSKDRATDLSTGLNWLQNNPITIVYELATPTYEVIATNDDLYIDSYVDGHLDFNSAVPIQTVVFKNEAWAMVYVKPSKDYVVQFEADGEGFLTQLYLDGVSAFNQPIVKGINRFYLTNASAINHGWCGFRGIGCNISKVVVTEATDEQFGYFKGLQSVGEGGLEVRSHNKNLWNWAENDFSDYELALNKKSYYGKKFKLKPNTPYTISAQPYTLPSGHWVVLVVHSTTGTELEVINQCKTGEVSANRYVTQVVRTNAQGELPISVYVHEKTQAHWNEFKKFGIQIEEGNTLTGYVAGQSHAQQLTHEPLRAVGDVKDRYILIDGEWYIERNCGETVLDGSEQWTHMANNSHGISNFRTPIPNIKEFCSDTIICDKYSADSSLQADAIREGILVASGDAFYLRKKTTTASTTSQLKTFLQANPFRIVYELLTPTYEKIDYNSVSVYNDVTYITTNSAVPANLKVKNHGFNALLKPSTTYTIASNLGVQTIVTGTDTDSLRLTGEGTIKDVRLFEETVTDIPAQFNGIQSSFEQNYDETIDKYKVEIKTTGKNIFDGVLEQGSININTGQNSNNSSETRSKNYIKVKPNSTIAVSTTANDTLAFRFYDINKNYTGENLAITNGKTFKVPSNAYYARFKTIYGKPTDDYQLEYGNVATEYEPYKSSTISFYLDEPLRGKGDIRDRVFIENGEVKIERHFTEIILNGNDNEQWLPSATVFNNVYRYVVVVTDSLPNAGNKSVLCDRLPSIVNYTTDYENIYVGGTSDTFYGVVFLTKAVPTASVKSYLAENPMKVVYQLAEPTIETVDGASATLSVQIFKDGHLSFDSNIPVSSSKIEYTISVPVLNEVAEVSSITDEQDMLIVDMATQLAVMQLTL